jgi:uncharacterized cupin superfamily protein
MPKPAIIRFDANADLEQWPDFPESEIASGSRSQRGHAWFEDKERGLSAGIWEQEANISHWMNYPVTEFMLVLEGEVVIVGETGETWIGSGESFIIPKGLRCRWTQPGKVKKFFVILDDSSGAAGPGPLKVIKIDPKVKLRPSTPPSADVLHSPVPTQHTHEYFENSSGEFTVGVWDTTGYHRKLIDFPRHELMHLLEGAVTFTDDRGASQTFRAGDTFFVPLGTPNSWKSEGYLRKIYCIFQPAAARSSP